MPNQYNTTHRRQPITRTSNHVYNPHACSTEAWQLGPEHNTKVIGGTVAALTVSASITDELKPIAIWFTTMVIILYAIRTLWRGH